MLCTTVLNIKDWNDEMYLFVGLEPLTYLRPFAIDLWLNHIVQNFNEFVVRDAISGLHHILRVQYYSKRKP